MLTVTAQIICHILILDVPYIILTVIAQITRHIYYREVPYILHTVIDPTICQILIPDV